MLPTDCKDKNACWSNCVPVVYSTAYFASGKILYLKKPYEVYSLNSTDGNKYFSLEIPWHKFVSIY